MITRDIIVTFDYEGLWGMPHVGVDYDLPAVTDQLLTVLKRHQVSAVFFTSSKLYYDYPQTIQKIHQAGHEVGVHGHAHEHLHNLSQSERDSFAQDLEAACKELERLTGRRPRGFRAPYLMGPLFYVPKMYQLLADMGFTWISNREIRTPEELWRPDRLPFGISMLKFPLVRPLLLAALNLGLLRHDRPTDHQNLVAAWRWLSRPQPFQRPEGLMEHPLVSPLDCDMVGFPKPDQASGRSFTDFTRQTILDDYHRSPLYFNINVHDWIIGTSDRLQVLDDALAAIRQEGTSRFILPGRSL